MDEKLMTEEEFAAAAKAWADRVRALARAAGGSFPHGKRESVHVYKTGRYAGKSERKLGSTAVGYVLRKHYGEVDGVSFRMPVHGIFREYGVGNGQPRHGVATKSGKRASGNVRIRRSMSDWFHAPLERNIDAFADLVADYYGDKYLVNFRRLGANDVVNGGF